jgi:hypothetical protein
MLYAGKRPEDLSLEELQGALVYCHQHMQNAERVYQLNHAAMAELSIEIDRREQRPN